MSRAEAASSEPSSDPTYAAAFSGPLLHPEQDTPKGVCGSRGKTATKRYNVYRNNVTVSLIEALATTFPAVRRIAGADFFQAMARCHVRAHPPTSPLLFDYGRDFPAFIARYDDARPLPWLADVARVERAWLDAYHAADAAPLASDTLGRVPPDRLEGIVFEVHPATRIVRSRFSAVSIFAANRSEGPVAAIDTMEPEDALITRPYLDVTVRHLPTGGAAFLTRLVDGEPLGRAALAATEDDPSFDLSRSIAGMIEAGVFVAIMAGEWSG